MPAQIALGHHATPFHLGQRRKNTVFQRDRPVEKMRLAPRLGVPGHQRIYGTVKVRLSRLGHAMFSSGNGVGIFPALQ